MILLSIIDVILRPFINDVTVSTFIKPESHHWILFPYKLVENKTELISQNEMIKTYPKAWEYLKQKSSILRDREGGKWKHEKWYALGRTQNLTQMDLPKIIVQVISRNAKYAFDDDNLYFTGGGNGPYYGMRWISQDNPHSLHYLQALLNSKVVDYFHHKISSPFRDGYWSYGKRFIEQLPIRAIDFTNPAEKSQHDKMVALVSQMLELHKSKAGAKTQSETDVYERQIRAVDGQIDSLVYELYGLTDEEIRIVEN